VSFLKEQINPQNKPLLNRAFEIQIATLRNADTEKVALRILQKQKQLENARDTETIETLYTELELWREAIGLEAVGVVWITAQCDSSAVTSLGG
jgi:hypothetical protein